MMWSALRLDVAYAKYEAVVDTTPHLGANNALYLAFRKAYCEHYELRRLHGQSVWINEMVRYQAGCGDSEGQTPP